MTEKPDQTGPAATSPGTALSSSVSQMSEALLRCEERLRACERRYRIVSQLLTDYSFQLSVAKDGSVAMEYVTENFYSVTGRTMDDVATVASWSRIMHPDDLPKLHALLARLIRQPFVERLECRSFKNDNEERWIEVAATSEWDDRENRVTSIIGVVKDITTRRMAEEALRTRESYLTAIIENQPGLVWSKDAQSRFLAVNRAFARSCGRENPEELIGKTDFTIWPQELAEKYRADDAAVIASGMPVIVEEQILDKGERRWFETFKTPVKNTRGETIGTTGYARDITERKREEEALRNVQKLESLGLLAGGIAHDFNNLLGGIFGFIDLAAASTSEKEVKDTLARALSTINRARGLTQQLLTFAKGGFPIKKVESLVPFVQETAQFALSGSHVSCEFHIAPDLWVCEFDRNQIGQVIDNIVINAQQAMPGGGTITLSAQNVVVAGKPPVAAIKPGPYVCLSVADHGIGIPREIIPRIFDPFFTTKERGHGLGLATCHSIVRRHGGTIDVASEPGKGSTFRIYLPARPDAVSGDTTNRTTVHRGSGLIIVMDDECFIRETVSRMLKAIGYTTIVTSNGREAIQALEREKHSGTPVKAMILDLTVPGGMGGKEAIAEIRAIDPALPVFVASGYADNPVVADPERYGFTASISKPFIIKTLAEMLKKADSQISE